MPKHIPEKTKDSTKVDPALKNEKENDPRPLIEEQSQDADRHQKKRHFVTDK